MRFTRERKNYKAQGWRKKNMDDLDDGFLGIAISDDEKVDDSGADTTAAGRNGSGDAAPAAAARADRNALSEEDYLVVKKEYRARMENGEVSHSWHTCTLLFPSLSLSLSL